MPMSKHGQLLVDLLCNYCLLFENESDFKKLMNTDISSRWFSGLAGEGKNVFSCNFAHTANGWATHLEVLISY